MCGNATACIVPFQTAKLKKGQRLISNSGSASMGHDLPAAIGVAIARNARTICLAGDGSLQMNIQELQTVVGNQLPMKIFVLNNGGYLSIRANANGLLRRAQNRREPVQRRHVSEHGAHRSRVWGSVVYHR